MSRIKSTKTAPELIFKKTARNLIYQPIAFGKPDFISFPKKTVIFVDGCFWHMCPIHFNQPKTNRDYWKCKLQKNAVRDQEVNIAYRNAGWKVGRIWEHEL